LIVVPGLPFETPYSAHASRTLVRISGGNSNVHDDYLHYGRWVGPHSRRRDVSTGIGNRRPGAPSSVNRLQRYQRRRSNRSPSVTALVSEVPAGRSCSFATLNAGAGAGKRERVSVDHRQGRVFYFANAA
jgi:hypothetical protein